MYDESHITDEAKLACKCASPDLPITTSPVLGLLVCITRLFKKWVLGLISGPQAYMASDLLTELYLQTLNFIMLQK